MKHKLFLLLWLSMLAFCAIIVGVLALLGYANAEVGFWSQSAIESQSGKIVWVATSVLCLVTFLRLASKEYKKGSAQTS